MKIFIDSASPSEIKRFAELGIVGGITTNPTLLVKQISGEISSPAEAFLKQKKVLKEICDATFNDKDIPILAEPVSTNSTDIAKEALELYSISNEQIVAKIPLTVEGLKAARLLKNKKIRVAFTLIFSTQQALVASAAGADYICPFVGRLDDSGQNGISVISEMEKIYRASSIPTKIIAASIRNTEHVSGCALSGVYAATCPPKVIDEMLNHPLTAKGVEKFIADWNSIIKK